MDTTADATEPQQLPNPPRTTTQELILAVQRDRAASQRNTVGLLGALLLLLLLGGTMLRPTFSPPLPPASAPAK